MFQPNPNINYAFVSLMYACGSLLYISLYVFEQWSGEVLSVQNHSVGEAFDTDGFTRKNDESSTSPGVLKELQTSLQGIYLIFSPFIPCLMWSLFLWRKSNNAGKNSKAHDEQKQKGD